MSAQHIKTWQERLTPDERDEYDGVDQHTPAEIAMMAQICDLRARIAEQDKRIAEMEQAIDIAIQLQNQAQSDAESAERQVAELQAALSARQPVEAEPDTSQDWAKLDGATAFHLIERHAEDWADTRRMMEAWRNASTAPSSIAAQQPAMVGAYKWADFSEWLASPIIPPQTAREYAHAAFEAARAILAQQGPQAASGKTGSVPHTYGAFSGRFYDKLRRQQTDQEAFDAGMRAGRDIQWPAQAASGAGVDRDAVLEEAADVCDAYWREDYSGVAPALAASIRALKSSVQPSDGEGR